MTIKYREDPPVIRWDHLFDIGFSVVSDTEDASDVTPAMFRAALLSRIAELDEADEWAEVLGPPIETDEIEDIVP